MVDAMKVWRDAYRAMRNAGVPGLDEDDRASAAATVIQAALDEARAETERQIVEWLRAEDAARPGDNWLAWIAGRIEKGEHRG